MVQRVYRRASEANFSPLTFYDNLGTLSPQNEQSIPLTGHKCIETGANRQTVMLVRK